MTDKSKRDVAPDVVEAVSGPDGETQAGRSIRAEPELASGTEPPSRPPARREFQIVQYGLTVPKPSYYGELKDVSGSFESAADSDPHSGEPYTDDLSPDLVVASRRTRARKMRLWAFFLFVIVIYGLLRTAQYMR